MRIGHRLNLYSKFLLRNAFFRGTHSGIKPIYRNNLDVMSLVAVAWPQSESDFSVMPCTLEAHGIEAFVHGGGFGSLFPGS